MKKKDTMMILSGLLGIGLAMAIQLFSSSMVKFEKNTLLMAQSFTAPNGLVSVVGKTYYPAIMATKGIINSGSAAGIVNLLLIAGISVLLTVLLIYSMSGVYFNSNIGSDEVKKETKKYNESEFKEKLRGKTSLMSLLSREIKLMNREPIYLLNGPMIILIMPLMFGMIFLIQKDNMTELTSQIDKITSATYYITLAVAGMGMFLGITGTPTSSAISREGKGFMQIKAMPMSPRDYINAKLLHGIIIGVLAALMSCALGYFLVSLPLVNCVIAFVISNLIMIPIMIAGLLIDLKWPKLLWDNPVKAMKQNVNVMVVVLGEMFVVLPVLGLLIYFLLREPSYGYLVLIAFPTVASVILYAFLMKFGEKRFYDIEI
jgi:ABC-2 type transport system permease protein